MSESAPHAPIEPFALTNVLPLMRPLLLLPLMLLAVSLPAQQLYYPPLFGNTWATTDPAELGWCTDQLPALYDFLEDSNSKAFIVLKDGRIVLERYFGTFTTDSVWYWASAGKSLTAFLAGIAYQEGLLDLDAPTSSYLGAGWTSCTPEQEEAITVRNQLTMTTGLNDTGDLDCTDAACLTYLAPAGPGLLCEHPARHHHPGARYRYRGSHCRWTGRVVLRPGSHARCLAEGPGPQGRYRGAGGGAGEAYGGVGVPPGAMCSAGCGPLLTAHHRMVEK